MATRMRIGRYARQPDPVAYSTLGDHLASGLAQACAGKLPTIARKMGRSPALIFKWAEAVDRGPEFELGQLFLAGRAAGVPRERMAILLARIQSQFENAFQDTLPSLDELDARETAIDGAEDVSQMARRVDQRSPEALARNYHVLLEDIAVRQTLAARLLRELHAQGLT